MFQSLMFQPCLGSIMQIDAFLEDSRTLSNDAKL